MSYTVRYNPSSFFFTDPGTFSQAGDQAFGPEDTDRFRLTTGFTANGNGLAYAACKGVALVQPQSGSSDKVNLILRPFTQPITGLNIKYFVYRGLNRSDFFSGDNVIAESTATSDLVNVSNKAFKDFYEKFHPGETVPAFQANYLGFDPGNQPDSQLISKLFFKRSETTGTTQNPQESSATAFELPMVQQGASLGHFAAGAGGFDVVLSYGDYELPQPNDQFVFDLAYARAANWVLDLNGISDAFKKKQTREHIFQFLDAAAYYGFHTVEGGAVMLRVNGTPVKKAGTAIYNELLQGFSTKNTFYLYIQSDRTRSYNFYGNYRLGDTGNNSLHYGTSDAMMTEREYATDGWPIIIDKISILHDSANSPTYIRLSTDRNPDSMLYGLIAKIDNAQSNNFLNAQTLLAKESTDDITPNLTIPILLVNPVVKISGATLFIANFNILIYQGARFSYSTDVVTDGVAEDVEIQVDSPDVFNLINAIGTIDLDDQTQKNVVTFQRIKLISDYFNAAQNGLSAVQTSITNDLVKKDQSDDPYLERVTYGTEAVDVLSSNIDGPAMLSFNTQSISSSKELLKDDRSFTIADPFYYTLESFQIGPENFKGPKLKSKDDSIPNKVLIGLTKAENENLKMTLSTNGLSNPSFVLRKVTDDTASPLSSANTSYGRYVAAIAGEALSGKLKYSPVEGLILYSLDNRFYFSLEYSRYMTTDLIDRKGDIYNENLNLV